MAEYPDLAGYPDDYIGIVPIYKPCGHIQGRIYLFHGPDGSWYKTWVQESISELGDDSSSDRNSTGTRGEQARPNANSDRSFWPRTLLPRAFPSCAVYSIGHKSEWFVDETRMNYDDALLVLLRHLIYTPLEQRAPIVFIAHGFRGTYLRHIILKIWGANGSLKSCTPFRDQLHGVVFLATPHRITENYSSYHRFFSTKPWEGTQNRVYQRGSWLFHGEEKFTPTWLQTLSSITTEFRAFLDPSNRPTKIVSVSEVSPPLVFQAGETTLGDCIVDIETTEIGHATYFKLAKLDPHEFERMSGWLTILFESALDRNWTEWNWTYFSTEPRRPSDVLFQAHGSDLLNRTNPRFIPMMSYPARYRPDCWIHFPVNEDSKMNGAMNAMSPSCIAQLEAFDDLSNHVLRARANFPHSRHVLPTQQVSRVVEGDCDVTCVRIFLPYLHWDTSVNAEAYMKDIKDWHRLRLQSDIDESQDISPEQWMRRRRYGVRSIADYHPRRTLDQFYYSRTEDTSQRDADQVVFRQTRDLQDPSQAKLIMVDQLWLCLWLVSKAGKHHSSGVLTSFPRTETTSSEVTDTTRLHQETDIRHRVIDALEKEDSCRTAGEVASLILATALVDALPTMRKAHWSLDVMELFREAIGDAANRFDRFFRTFADQLASDAAGLSIDLRRDEVRTTLEIADIIEELQMLEGLFGTQTRVLRQEMSAFFGSWRNTSDIIHFANKLDKFAGDIDVTRQQVLGMIKDAKQIRENLMDLLDLQQKEEHIYEAHNTSQTALFTAKQALSAQHSADAIDAQSQILFAFTLVTIVFLPLSFLTSWFGMNIDDGKGAAVNYKYSDVRAIMASASTPIIGGLFFFGGLLYWYSTRASRKERTRLLIDLTKQRRIPRGLLDVKDLRMMNRMGQKLGVEFSDHDDMVTVQNISNQADNTISAGQYSGATRRAQSTWHV